MVRMAALSFSKRSRYRTGYYKDLGHMPAAIISAVPQTDRQTDKRTVIQTHTANDSTSLTRLSRVC